MTKRTVIFNGARTVEVWEEPIPTPTAGELLVKTTASAISAGTEMLVYRDQFPDGMSVDSSFNASAFTYPLAYGYAAVGEVVAVGDIVGREWLGRRVFGFQPHTSHWTAAPASVYPLPDDVDTEAALFLPNTETAVNLVQDGAPLLGENVVVVGVGVVGQLTAAILTDFPLSAHLAVDGIALRRDFLPSPFVAFAPDESDRLTARLGRHHADLIFELSGNPAALDSAIAWAGYGGRIVVGSWYGSKRASLDLGGAFHRNRIQLISSQVSTIAPHLRGRWDKARRFDVVWDALRRIQPQRLITHRYAVGDAAAAYRLLDTQPEQALGVVLHYAN
jgi:2-desacetyl-2-hydroxyethyl bacteriochlorophyllide A dehydrogenase